MLFRVAGLPMVENCMAGYNSCIFAYGQVFVINFTSAHLLIVKSFFSSQFNCLQTGSGKTYTMLGEISELEVRPSQDRGMTPRIFEFLFARIRAVKNITMSLQFMVLQIHYLLVFAY